MGSNAFHIFRISEEAIKCLRCGWAHGIIQHQLLLSMIKLLWLLSTLRALYQIILVHQSLQLELAILHLFLIIIRTERPHEYQGQKLLLVSKRDKNASYF